MLVLLLVTETLVSVVESSGEDLRMQSDVVQLKHVCPNISVHGVTQESSEQFCPKPLEHTSLNRVNDSTMSI